MITICPHCGQQYRNIPEHAAGRKTTCTRCKTSFVVRASEEQSTEQHSHQEWQVGDLILERYEVRQILGQGGFGRVYLLYHKAWDMHLAVKTPNSKAIAAAGGVENFEREAETWVNLGLHPNTVSCYYVRRIDDVPRVFAEYVSGGDLHSWIKDGRLYEGDETEVTGRILDIAIQFARGLHYAHEQQLIHQDVKPANLMLTEEGQAKVTDFGLARARALAETHATGHTMMVKGVGYTPEYASPEQLAGARLTRRTDIWSWAVSILEAFSGQRTWRSGTIAGFHLDEYLTNGTTVDGIPTMPGAVASILRQCFNEDPDQRPHDLLVIGEQLEAIYRDITGKAYPRREAKAGRDTADSLNNRAISMLDLGRQDDAIATWQQALAVEPYHPESTYNHGLTLWQMQMSDDEPLMQKLQHTMQVTEPAWLSRYLLGLVHLHRGDCMLASETLKPASGFRDNDVDIDKLLHIAEENRFRSRRILTSINDEWPVHAVALDAEGELVVTGGQDRGLHVWNAYERKKLKTLTGHTSTITCLSLSSSASTVLSGSQNAELKHWDINAGTCLFTSKDHVGPVSSVCISHDGHRILSGSEDQSIRIWSATERHRYEQTLHGHHGAITSLATSPDDELLLSTSEDRTAKLWQLDDGHCLQTMTGHDGAVTVGGFLGDERIITGSDDRTLRIWRIKDGQCIDTLKGHSAPVTAMAISMNHPFIISGSENGTIKIWDRQHLVCLCTFTDAHKKAITGIDYSRNSGHVITAGMDNAVHLWSMNKQYDFKAPVMLSKIISSEAVLSSQAEFDNQLSLARQAVSEHKSVIAMQHIRKARQLTGFGNSAEAMQLWRILYPYLQQMTLESVWQEHKTNLHQGPIRSTDLSPDGNMAVSGGEDATVRLWDTANGQCIKSMTGHEGPITCVAFSHCQQYTISAGKDAIIRLWDIGKGKCIQTFSGHSESVTCVALDASGKYLVSGSLDKTLKMWALHTGECLRTFRGHQQAVSCCWIQYDGRHLVSGSEDRTIRLWDLATGDTVTSIGTFGGHSRKITQIAAGYTGRTIISASTDGTLKLWDPATGNCYRTINAHSQAINSLAVSVDGQYALTGGQDGSIRFWQLKDGSCLNTLISDINPVNAVALSMDKGIAVSGDHDGSLGLWTFDWSLAPLPDFNPRDDKLTAFIDTFIRKHTPCNIVADKHGQPRQSITTTKQLHARWNDAEMKQLSLVLGYANIAGPPADSLNELLQNHLQSSTPRKQEQHMPDERTGSAAAASAQFVSAPSTGFRQPGLFSGLPPVAQILIVVIVVLVIAIGIYRLSVSHMEKSMLEEISSYVESGHDIGQLRLDGNLPLHAAARNGYLKVADYLLQHGADINAKDSIGWTPLHHAVYANDVAMVRLLINNGAERHHQAGMGAVTPLWMASDEGYDDIIIELKRAQ